MARKLPNEHTAAAKSESCAGSCSHKVLAVNCYVYHGVASICTLLCNVVYLQSSTQLEGVETVLKLGHLLNHLFRQISSLVFQKSCCATLSVCRA